MKTIIALSLLIIIIGTIGAADTESYQFIDHLLRLPGPGKPDIYEGTVIFTAPSTHRKVGIAFAHEGFARVYWFRKLLVPRDEAPESRNKKVDPYLDAGLLFFVYEIPEDIRELRYRMIINGLWTTDPLNPLRAVDPVSGLAHSLVSTPVSPKPLIPAKAPPGLLSFSYKASPGERITVAGSFNGWDPFMYELREIQPGLYALTLPLPPGIYRYVFFHRGERVLDPNNPNRVYTRDGRAVNEAAVP